MSAFRSDANFRSRPIADIMLITAWRGHPQGALPRENIAGPDSHMYVLG
jgi:hypothetical protein